MFAATSLVCAKTLAMPPRVSVLSGDLSALVGAEQRLNDACTRLPDHPEHLVAYLSLMSAYKDLPTVFSSRSGLAVVVRCLSRIAEFPVIEASPFGTFVLNALCLLSEYMEYGLETVAAAGVCRAIARCIEWIVGLREREAARAADI